MQRSNLAGGCVRGGAMCTGEGAGVASGVARLSGGEAGYHIEVTKSHPKTLQGNTLLEIIICSAMLMVIVGLSLKMVASANNMMITLFSSHIENTVGAMVYDSIYTDVKSGSSVVVNLARQSFKVNGNTSGVSVEYAFDGEKLYRGGEDLAKVESLKFYTIAKDGSRLEMTKSDSAQVANGEYLCLEMESIQFKHMEILVYTEGETVKGELK